MYSNPSKAQFRKLASSVSVFCCEMIIATVINFSFMILECFSTPSCFQDLNLALYFLVLLKVILDFITV